MRLVLPSLLALSACDADDELPRSSATEPTIAMDIPLPPVDTDTPTVPPETTTTTTTPPPPPPTTPVCETDICVVYGAAVPAVSAGIVAAAAVDPTFADFFAPVVAGGGEAALAASLTDFITDAYGCTTGAYTGASMEDAHAGMGITQQEYDDFITLIAGVLLGAGVPEDDVNLCFAPPLVDPAFSATIVGQ